ncbi:MAG: type II toxin-antitoxin system VapC family toxin [bacterium]
MNAVDTSVVVAAFATWHPAHLVARRKLDSGPRLPGHAGLEAYSVLTRLPQPHRAGASEVRAFLRAEFGEPWLVLDGTELPALVERLVALGIAGGPTYDALIGATAKHAGATLITRDRRALVTYQRLGVDVEFFG